MMFEKKRRDLKPDAQAFDKIVIETAPRYKESELSGDEWRISAIARVYRKGKEIFSFGAANVEYAARMLDFKMLDAVDNGLGFFGGEDDVCDQEGCAEKATVRLEKKYDWSRDGHKSQKPSNGYRLFCERHSHRGDCGLDDADDNYNRVALGEASP